MSLWLLPTAAAISTLAWWETRRLGNVLDDVELEEAAPLVGGLTVAAAGALTLLVDPRPALVVLAESCRLAAGAMIYLLGLQALLAYRGVITPEWTVLPAPLDAHAREKWNQRQGRRE